MKFRNLRRRRRGVTTIEVIFTIATLFVIAMVMYWIADAGFAGLYSIIANHNGSPYL